MVALSVCLSSNTPTRIGRALPALFLLACGDPAGTGPVTPVPRVAVAAHLPFDSVFFGRTTRVTALASGDSATVAAARFTWRSSDTTVAVVDSSGVVLGVGLGRAVIAAEYLGHRGETSVRVVLRDASAGVRFVEGHTTMGDGGCAIGEDGRVYCRHVAASTDSMPVFRPMPGAAGIRFTEVHTAFGTQCGLADDGQIHCWGANRRFVFASRLPNQTITEPFAVRHGTLRFSTMTAGGHEQICAIARGDGTVYCWGHNDGYQLGREPLAAADSTVAPMSGAPRAHVVATANFATCFIDLGGALRCAGNDALQLGVVDAATNIRAPQPIVRGDGFHSVILGDRIVCALSEAGAASCSGTNPGGRLGIGTTTEPAAIALRAVSGGLRFRELSLAGTYASNAVCGITLDDELYCWGPFHPAIVSDRRETARTAPVRMFPGLKVRAMSRTVDDACVIARDGRALCW